MVGLPYDCLANPLGAVRLTFEKAVASRADPATFDGSDWGAADLFREFLFDNDGLSQVPILNAANVGWIQPNTLVRYRGMIQDMLGNEFYVGAYKDGARWRTNKFTDVSRIPMNLSSNMRVWERRLLYCVPVPGQNSWTESSSDVVLHPCENWESLQREKRQRENDTAADDMDMQGSDHDFQGSPRTKKMREGGPASRSSHPRETTKGTSPNINAVLDFDRNSLPCLVKVYDSPEDDLKLNDVFEFVGVLTFDAETRDDKDDSEEFTSSFCEDEMAHLPPSKVPRLHCLVHRKLAVHDFLSTSPRLEPKPSLVKEIRETLLGHLTAVLGNDGVAAHLMLLHLLSKVHTRVDTLAVGKLSLNLTGFNVESASVFGNRLNLAIKNILPFTRCIPLTVDYLNTASLAPRKDYQTNRLVSGVIQLAEGSHVTIDETQLQAGTLKAVGVENTRLLKKLMELQKVEYDFKYYKMEMAADVQLLILSEGKSNILPADLVLPFSPSSVGSSEVVDADALKAWRWYLSTLRSLPHSIEPEMQKVVEDDLVAARQSDRSLGSQEFSRWLTMGRLMSVSFGETCLSLEHWQMVKELERLRRERLE
ncbi:Mini-chromosome maintenance complex-binding protein [Actinidia chinensis var. chinensis]|uniref:Mini-chromosome maintenance complex-binding protein n=1 Tax=Actinidia chinensis var. chinensis TaxID=1590841 RepID=A0A2R6PLN6_ACTCC|nr:Mini-chromosome maintenance complex-binding protein [Actinidia chinensis var. chinensis]